MWEGGGRGPFNYYNWSDKLMNSVIACSLSTPAPSLRIANNQLDPGTHSMLVLPTNQVQINKNTDKLLSGIQIFVYI